MPTLTMFLTFDNQAEEATKHCTSIFGGKILSTNRYPAGGPKPEGTVLSVTFQILGQTIMALNAGPSFTFTPGFSMFVGCDTQAEIDAYWSKLTDGGKSVQCGWLVDKFGLSWQIVPKALREMLSVEDGAKAGRTMQAMMPMKKLDIATLQLKFDGG